MKTHIWNLVEPFPTKVNFVDSNNVVLGYDLEHQCCEDASWVISESPYGGNPIYESDKNEGKELTLENYCFDPDYCVQRGDEFSETYTATFILKARSTCEPKLPDLFVILKNRHNGYYSHGFTFRGTTSIEGAL